MPWAGLLAALSAGVLFNVGSALQALDAREAPADEGLRLKLLARLARRRRWIAGLLLGGLGFVLQVLAFAGAPFVVVQPALAAGLVVLVAIGWRVLGERVTRGELAGVATIGVGIALLGWGAPAHNEALRSGASAIAIMAVLGLLAVAPFALRGGRLDSAMLVIVASALGFGATNIATKLLSDDVAASHWILAAAWGAPDVPADPDRAALPARGLGDRRAGRRAACDRPGARPRGFGGPHARSLGVRARSGRVAGATGAGSAPGRRTRSR